MAVIDIKLEGVEDLRRRIRMVSEEVVGDGVKAAARAMATHVLPLVLARVPVDTGWLKDAIELKIVARKGEAQATVGANRRRIEQRGRFAPGDGARAPYDFYVEYGTEDTEAQPFLRPALDEGAQGAVEAGVGEFEVILDALGERAG